MTGPAAAAQQAAAAAASPDDRRSRLELYHIPPSRSLRVLWALEELGLGYTLHKPAWPVSLTVPGYLELNPIGTLPTLIDNGVAHTESMAIIEHLSRVHGNGRFLVDPGAAEFTRYLRWMWFGESTLSNALANVMRYGPYAPEDKRIPAAVDDAIETYLGRLVAIEKDLGPQDYAVGDEITLADFALGYGIFIGVAVGLIDRLGPRTRKYWDAISSRPAFIKALDA